MKITHQSVLASAGLVVGLALGTSALVALADTTWTAAPANPPNNNVAAPINVGALTQTKTGLLGLANLIVTNFTVATGTPVAGKVLTALDSSGTVGWGTVAAASGGGIPSNIVSYATPGTYNWTAPAGVTKARVRVWGGGGIGNAGYSSGQQASDCAGGGGGGYAESVISVTPGMSYNIIVGAGGDTNTFTGGNSSFNPQSGALVSANGGGYGDAGYTPTGGTGGTAVGQISITGGSGQTAYTGGLPISCPGGSSPNGGNAGIVPGGGGNSSGSPVRHGAGGAVVLEY